MLTGSHQLLGLTVLRTKARLSRGPLPADKNAPNLLVCDDSCTPRERLHRLLIIAIVCRKHCNFLIPLFNEETNYSPKAKSSKAIHCCC